MNKKQEIVSKLKFIGKLQKGDKINTKHMYVQPDGFGTSFYRTFWAPDNRSNALTFVNEIINRSFELLVTYDRSSSTSDEVLRNLLVKDLKNSISGLTNLKFTYINDTKFCCDMDTLLEYIHAELTKFIHPDDLKVSNKKLK